jgi:O-antigen ligase/tetratricopeptide (TPR) repeat protein
VKVDTAAPSIESFNKKPAEIVHITGLWHRLSSAVIWISIVVAILVFSPLFEGGTTHIAVMTIRLMILALASVAIYQTLSRGRIDIVSEALATPIILFLILASCSVAFSAYTHHSAQWLMVLVSYAVFLHLLVFFISRWEHVACLLGTFVAMALIEMALSFVQFSRGAARPSGTFFNPNFLAGYLVAAWTVLLSYMSFQPYQRYLSGRISGCYRVLTTDTALSLSLFVALTLAIVLTGSRGGIFAATIGASIVVGTRFGRRGLLLFLISCLLGLVLVPNPLRERIYAEHAFNPTTYARWEMWESAMRMVMDHPLGIGLGLYQYVFPQYAFPVESQIARYGTVAQTPHNEYLQIAVEMGIASLSMVCWGLYLLTRQICSGLSRRLTRFQRQLLVGTAGAIGSLLAHAVVDSNLHEPALAIVLTVFVSIVVSSGTLLNKRRKAGDALLIKHRAVWGGAATLLLGLLVVVVLRLGVAWMYYENGNELNRRNDLDGAMKQYSAAVAVDPAKALYHSAVAAVSFRKFERSGDLNAARMAVDHLDEAITLNPLDGRLAGLLGKVYLRITSLPVLRQEQKREAFLLAEQAYQRAIAREPFNVTHYWEAGQVQLKLGNKHEGESLIKHAVEIEPNFLRARDWLSRSYLERRQLSLAQDEYQQIRDRQDRYRDVAKTLLEREFLAVDTDALGAALFHAKGEG